MTDDPRVPADATVDPDADDGEVYEEPEPGKTDVPSEAEPLPEEDE